MPTIEQLGEAASNFNPQGDKFLRIVQNWGQEIIENMRNNLRKHNALASKNLYQQIEAMPSFTPQGANLKINMLEYWEWVDQGRPPTKSNTKGNPTLQQSLEEWIRFKGIQVRTSSNQNLESRIKSLAFVIARKIHSKGYKAKPFVTPAITKETLQTLSDRLGQYISDSITANN